MTDSKAILGLLRRELTLQRRHLAILREQQTALISRDDPRFSAAHAMYEHFCHELEAHADDRKAILGDPVPSMRAVIEAWDPVEAKAGLSLLNTIQVVIERVRTVALQNNQMVTNHLMYVQFMLSVMVRTRRKSLGYAPVKRNIRPLHGEHIFINQVA